MYSCRKLKGEDLQGVDLEELLKLERLIEDSLSRVIDTKVCIMNNFSLESHTYPSVNCEIMLLPLYKLKMIVGSNVRHSHKFVY